MDLWKPSESFPLIDLGEDYYIVRFNKEENMINSIKKEHGLFMDIFYPYNTGFLTL